MHARHWIAVAALGLVAAVNTLADERSRPAGLDRQTFDAAARPQDDLFRHVNGGWLRATQIPADRASYGVITILRMESERRIRDIIESLAATPAAPGSDARRIGDFWASYMDEARIAALGAKPLAPVVAEIDALADRRELVAAFARLGIVGVNLPVGVDVFADLRDSGVYAAYIGQGGLGLPNRDYYLRDDPAMQKLREQYVGWLARSLDLLGERDTAACAARVFALEKRLAQSQWTPVQNRDPVSLYNPMQPAELATLAPGIDWMAYLDAATLGPRRVVVMQPSYVEALGRAVQEESLETWRDYLKVRVVNGYASLLSPGFVQASFDFNSGALRGMTEMRPRWQRATYALEEALGEALGREYVARHFPPAAKQRMDELVANLVAAFDDSIDRLDWMGPETRAQAHDKLRRMRVKIGYPAKWRDYSSLEVRADDLVGNVLRARRHEYARVVGRVGGPVDRDEWGMTPQTVNAYYDPTGNEIVFPAAYLQPPNFDAAADDAVNYGAIGTTIGHEISHGFDDEGRKFDGVGNLRDWWTPEDDRRFKARAQGLVAQFNAYEALPGLEVNGELTLGENIADLSGLTVALRAYRRSLRGQPAPVIDGLTGEQRFFMGYAQSHREMWREQLMREVVLNDPHALNEFRTNGPPSNMAEFYDAFGVREGDRLWRPAGERVRIW